MANTTILSTDSIDKGDQNERELHIHNPNQWIFAEDAARTRPSPERERLRRESEAPLHLHSPTAADEPNGMFSVLRHYRVHWASLARETRVMVRLAIPFALTTLFLSVPIEVSIAFCGHLSKLELDAAGLSISLFMIFSASLGSGIGSQAAGAFAACVASKQSVDKLRLQLHRALGAAVLVWAAFSLPVLMNTEWLLLHCGQNVRVARLSARYTRVLLPGTLFHALFEVLSKFLEAQEITVPGLLCSVAYLPLAIGYHTVFVQAFGWRSRGAAAALGLTFATRFLVLALVVARHPTTAPQRPFALSRKSLSVRGAIDCAVKSLGSMAQTALYWCATEVGTLLTGAIGTAPLAAQSVIIHFMELFYAIPEGLQTAAIVRIGSHIGERSVRSFHVANLVSNALQMTTGLLTALFYVCFRSQLAAIFTNDKKVIKLAAQMVGLVALNDLLSYASHGPLAALRAAGRMGFAAFATLVPLNLVALPLAAYLMFGGRPQLAEVSRPVTTLNPLASELQLLQMKIMHPRRRRPPLLTASQSADGLASYWMAIDVGVALQLLMLIVYTSRIDWRALILHERRERGSIDSGETSSTSEVTDTQRP